MTNPQSPDAPTSCEVVLDELLGDDGETIAIWKVGEGLHGPLAVYEELSPQAHELLRSSDWQYNPRGQAFMAHYAAAGRAHTFVSNKRFGNYAQRLGFSYVELPEEGVVRRATLPTAEALNGALDAMPHMSGRMRFYEPTTSRAQGRNTPLEEFIPRLELGLAPLPPPAHFLGSNFFHDLTDHGIGYTFIDAKRTDAIKRRAGELKNLEIHRDGYGMADEENPAVAFAITVDGLSSALNRNMLFDFESSSREIFRIARRCAAITLKKEVELQGDKVTLGLGAAGFGAAIALLKAKRAEQ